MPRGGKAYLRPKASEMSSPTVTRKRQKLSTAIRCACSKVSSDESVVKQKLRNREIDKLLRRDKQEYRSTHRVVLLGPTKSGKGTILKQLSVLEPTHEKCLKIKKNIRDAVVTICNALKSLNPPIRLANSENETHVHYMITESIWFTEMDDFTDEFFDKVELLFKDEGFRKCYERRNEYNLFSSAKYFLDKISIIRRTDYTPSNQDFSMWTMPEGLTETKFETEKIKFHLFKPNQRLHHKCLQLFSEVTAVIFVVDTSAYDFKSHENRNKTALEEGLDMFKSLWNNRWLRTTSVILFLNKIDLLERKILSGKHPLEDYYPEFEGYRIPQDVRLLTLAEDPEVTRAKYFIRDEFLQLSQVGESRHYCYPHFTCGLDAENIHYVVRNDCRDIIQRAHLRQYELL